MAGSYRHCVAKNGELYGDQGKELLLDDLGDAYEAIEEMYDMIQYLSAGDRHKIYEAWREGHIRKRRPSRLAQEPERFTEQDFWYDAEEG
jgi:hypothetical protein